MKTLLILLLIPFAAARAQMAPTAGAVSSADGVSIHYDDLGSGSPAIVLIHGWTNSRRIWGRHPETLSRTNRVVNIDLAGHGESGVRDAWSMASFAEDVAAVVEDLELDQIVLVGFSMGGQVALAASERLPDETIGVVLVDALRDPDEAASEEQIQQLANAIRSGWGDPAFIRGFGFTPDAPDSLVQYLISIGPPTPQEHWFEMLPVVFEWQQTDRNAILQRSRVPVALINTSRRPTNLEAIHQLNDTVTLDTLSGVGHAGILLQRVDEFDEVLLGIVERMK